MAIFVFRLLTLHGTNLANHYEEYLSLIKSDTPASEFASRIPLSKSVSKDISTTGLDSTRASPGAATVSETLSTNRILPTKENAAESTNHEPVKSTKPSSSPGAKGAGDSDASGVAEQEQSQDQANAAGEQLQASAHS